MNQFCTGATLKSRGLLGVASRSKAKPDHKSHDSHLGTNRSRVRLPEVSTRVFEAKLFGLAPPTHFLPSPPFMCVHRLPPAT
ncbi:hypothetical protein PISMIDRAFT_515522 [Pisolithus microcarpus 441]|uniref:Uncharacterized protein n=1 Tax=Pisolithus microcarpus 441 TaxID=765257 RepID=A0A0C9YVI2_9AGAM|nr:hypothetical protein PISMIDRAFT_515522 [Pisolithus microcarpus 441]